MKRKSQRKRSARASLNQPRNTAPARISVAPVAPRRSSFPAAAALAIDGLDASESELEGSYPDLDAISPREPRLDSGEILIGARPRLFSQVDFHTESNFYSGYSGGLADGGVFVVTYAPLKLGQPVDVELSLPGGQFISVSGRVAFLRAPSQHNADLAPGAGIVLDEMDAAARRAAESFMCHREPTFVDPN